ncbi:MAG: glycosyltransferase, partial [Actinomycetota bacterium]|nr:glycosyltransferase [Actinomycetota bacterium]
MGEKVGDGASPSGRLRVCHLIHNLGDGGAERLLIEMAAAAPEAGLEISVVTMMPNAGKRHATMLRELGVRVDSLELSHQWDPRGFWRGIEMVRHHEPAVIHSHLKQADLVGAVVSRELGRPLISTLHMIESSVSPLGQLKRRLGAEARLRVATRTIAVSEAQRAWYLDTFRPGRNPVVTIHNGVRAPEPVSEDERVQARRELGIGDDDLLATMLGIMRPGKGHSQLIKAAGLLAPTSRIRFVCAGEGPLLQQLSMEAAQSSGAHGEQRVLFPGWCSDVSRLLAASDLIVHPTLFDALPTALIQGMAAGLPAVASDVGGVSEIVSDGCGLL